MEEAYNNASKHIAVLAFPFGTRAAPLLNIILQLSDACPDKVFSFLSTRRSNGSPFPKKLDNVKPFDVRDGLPEGCMFKDDPNEPVECFLKAVPGNFTVVLDEVVAETGKPIDCLITDAIYAFGADIADELNVPWVAIWTGGCRALFVHVEIDFIREYVGINGTGNGHIHTYFTRHTILFPVKVTNMNVHNVAGPQDKSLKFFPDFSHIRAADLPCGITTGDFNAAVPAMLQKMGLELPRATAIAVNSYEDLDSKVVNILKQRFDMYLSIGPFNLVSVSDSHGCLDWLSQHDLESVAYISFGSATTPPPQELQALCEALEESEFPFLWSFRGNSEKQLPSGFLERTSSKGKIVPRAPQQKILEHPSVGVFVSHGGWNSVLESIMGGVPMILRPFSGDQGLNTRTVEAVWGFGLGLEGGTMTKEGAMKALKLTLISQQGKQMRDKIGLQKELAYNAVKGRGSSVENFKTPVKVVNKHQFN